MKKALCISVIIWAISLNVLAQDNFDQKLKSTNTKAVSAGSDVINSTINFGDLPAERSDQKRDQFTPQMISYTAPKGDDKAKIKKINKLLFDIDVSLNSDISVNKSTNKTSLEGKTQQYLTGLEKRMMQSHPSEEWKVTTMNTDKVGNQHIRMAQIFNDVPVWGGEIILHSQQGTIQKVTGRYYATPNVSTKPEISIVAAGKLAMDHIKQETTYSALTPDQKALLKVEELKGELIIYHLNDEQAVLAYHFTIHPNFMKRYEYFMDANTGKILNHYDHTCSFAGPTVSNSVDLLGANRSFNTYQDGSTYYMYDIAQTMFTGNINGNFDGAVITLDMQNKSYTLGQYVNITSGSINSWNATAVSAHYNADVAYDYFRLTHNRNSINGQGGNIISFINVRDENNAPFDNAFWNGTAMYYGNGAQAFKPLARGKDVAGHEMSHGVIQNTANLTYQGESGAINESMADVFGAMIDRDDWLLGEDVVQLAAFPSGALRSLQDPHNGGNSLNDNGYQPKHVNEQYLGSEDNGGVHINSGITNYAFYLFASNASVGKDKAEDVYYHALVNHLTASSNFRHLRACIINSINDLNLGNAVLNAANSAFDAVGITSGGTTTGPSDIQTNNGDQYILSYDTDDLQAGTWYLIDVVNGTGAFISNTKSITKPSIRDDGAFAYFVRDDGNIVEMKLDGNQTAGTAISTSGSWDNVAISKDGRRLAAVTNNSSDNKIYIFDLTVNPATLRTFELYNPTFTNGVQTGEVLYADALEWDYTGQYVVYDAFNTIDNTNGNDYNFWDVGFLRAWNNGSNSFGTGTITKLFSTLPQNVSIGEPSFSKNSPSIIAFDELIDGATSNVLNANIETGDIARPITDNDLLNQANYSTNDRNELFNNQSGSTFYTGVIGLNADKLSYDGSNFDQTFIPDSRWGVWYAKGQRVLPTSVEDNVLEINENKVSVYPNPTGNELILSFEKYNTANILSRIIDMKGSIISNQVIGEEELNVKYDVSNLASGVYFIQLISQHKIDQVKFVKK